MRYQSEGITIECVSSRQQVTLRWLGRSDARDPRQTLKPLLEAVRSKLDSAQSVDFDFRSFDYMNSSTIGPLLRLIRDTSHNAATVRVLYDGTKNWQRLSFMAIGAVLASIDNVEVCP